MLILWALLWAGVFVALCRTAIKRHPTLFYLSAAAVTLLVGLIDGSFLPVWAQNAFLALFTRGAFATALWLIIMNTGALKNGSKLIKALMPIRGELSILAAILTLGHNICYGKTYFVRLFTQASSMAWTQWTAAVISLVMIALLLPLTVTSFPAVRRKIPGKKWKRLQRSAYAYYALLYVHIMLVTMPGALAGKSSAVISVLVYTALFGAYAAFRVRKYLVQKKKCDSKRTLAAALAAVLVALALCGGALLVFGKHAAPEEEGALPQSGDGEVVVSGHAYGYDGEVYATVTLKDGVMIDIDAYSEESDDYYFNHCYEKVASAILEVQNCEVDAVSGATYSSQALMDAVASALGKVPE